jgi:electron transfer flavoprotein alpha subunit
MDINQYKGILVYAECCGNKISENSLELLGEARRLSEQLGENTEVLAALIGFEIHTLSEQLMGFGADKVIVFDDERLSFYRPDRYAEALCEMIEAYKPAIVLIGATSQGSELAPTVAAKLKTGLAAHCVELKINEKKQLVQVVPAFGGKVLGDILCPNFRPQIASVKPGIMQKIPFKPHVGKVKTFVCNIDGWGDNLRVVAHRQETATAKSLHEYDVIVGGGFGIGSKEGWQQLEELAQLLGGATGCTRPALDEGWTCGEHTMIGTSGTAVRPKVYLNAGVSGAAHHTCAIKNAGTIISINKDSKASIFEVSDFRIVADWGEVIPLMIEKIKAIKGGCTC